MLKLKSAEIQPLFCDVKEQNFLDTWKINKKKNPYSPLASKPIFTKDFLIIRQYEVWKEKAWDWLKHHFKLWKSGLEGNIFVLKKFAKPNRAVHAVLITVKF